MSRKNDTSIYIYETDFSQTTYYHFRRLTHFINDIHSTQLLKFKTCIIFSNDTCICCDIGSSTTGVECTQCQLCTRLTDRLSSDYSDSFTLLNHTARSQVTSVTFSTNTLFSFTSQYRTDFNTLDRRILNLLTDFFCDFFSTGNYQFTSSRMNNIMYGDTSQDTFIQSSNNFIVILKVCTNQSTECTTVFFCNNHIM